MCELHAYLKRGNGEELVVENVEAVESAGEELHIRDVFGYRYRLSARIEGFDMLTHRLVLVESIGEGSPQ